MSLINLITYWVCWWIISFQFVFCVKDGLYSTKEDNVVTLNNNTFSAVLNNNSDIVWVIEFYNSWCGHCVHFAPTWVKLAAYFKEWRDLVVIAAVDCSQSVNLETCRKYNVDSYPTLQMFPPTSVANGEMERINSQGLVAIEKSVLNFMVKYAPKSWPHLQPLQKIEDIWQEKKDHHKHVVLIFEEQDSLVGTQVIIDLRNVSSVLVCRMLKNNVVKYGINKFPSLYKVRPDSAYSLLAIGSAMMVEDRMKFVQIIRGLTDQTSKESIQLSKDTEPDDNEKHENSLLMIPKQYSSSVVSMQDLESALHYSFRQEVAIKKFIDGEKLHALQRFVEVVLKYFPGRKPILGFLNRVNEMLKDLKVKNITGENWMSKIDHLQNEENYLPEVTKWESCQGSAPHYRGYPCSMWTLFHTLTVAAYNQEISARHNNPQEVLLAIRGYMKYFFGCQECSKHFGYMAQSIEDEVYTLKSSVLWLWSAHNKANKRLQGDASEDPAHPKIEFPSYKMCPQCHVVSSNGSSKISWDMTRVLEFLVKFYSEKSIVLSKGLQDSNAALEIFNKIPHRDKELDWWEKKLQEQDLKQLMLMQEQREKLNRDSINKIILSENSSFEKVRSKQSAYQIFHLLGLTQIDFSLCVIFYVISTVFIIGLYHHFIVRRRMVPCRNIASKIRL